MDQLKALKDTFNHIFWSLMLQGVVFIVLAILIIIYPEILFALVAATFLIVGAVLIVFALKIKSFWDKMPNFIKK